MKFISLTTLAAVFISTASALSLGARKAQDVFVPVITKPTAGDVWTVGSKQTVTWETSDAPAQITNTRGQIMLVKNGNATPLVLAAGFSIMDGSADVDVPNVINGTDYQVQLFGDSGDLSTIFEITGSNSFF